MNKNVVAIRETHVLCTHKECDPTNDYCKLTILLREVDKLETFVIRATQAWDSMGSEVYDWMSVACDFAIAFGGVVVEGDEKRQSTYERFFDLVDSLTDEYGVEYFPDAFNQWMGRETE